MELRKLQENQTAIFEVLEDVDGNVGETEMLEPLISMEDFEAKEALLQNKEERKTLVCLNFNCSR